jgi:threonine synthase
MSLPAATGGVRAAWSLRCADCGRTHAALEVRYRCDCGGTLDVVHAFAGGTPPVTLAALDARRGSFAPEDRSGVWRFRELVLPIGAERIVTRPEGNTNLYASAPLGAWTGLGTPLKLKHEGENPSGSFKDRGMTVAITVARALGMSSVACASTGNTSASMAAYAAPLGMRAYVFIPDGRIAYGKLGQSLAYGARTIQVRGNFDAAMALVERVCAERRVYLVNSVNPFRIEGQKSIAFELLQDLRWQVPDWIVMPGGNLGNSSAVCKGLVELHGLGLIGRLPRVAVVQAAGANPLHTAWTTGTALVPVADPQTIATAIRIGSPVSWRKCLRGLAATNGVVEQADDQQILDAKARVDAAGIGAEPASCAAVAGVRTLVERGVIAPGADVCAILTGHVLKDPDAVVGYHRNELDGIRPAYANPPVTCDATLDAVLRAMDA